eukprot:UN10184
MKHAQKLILNINASQERIEENSIEEAKYPAMDNNLSHSMLSNVSNVSNLGDAQLTSSSESDKSGGSSSHIGINNVKFNQVIKEEEEIDQFNYNEKQLNGNYDIADIPRSKAMILKPKEKNENPSQQLPSYSMPPTLQTIRP